MNSVFVGLAAVMSLAAIGGWIAKWLRQPPLLGYIAAGILLSALGLVDKYHTRELVEVLGQLGVTLLLFLVGLELPVPELKRMGKVALMTGVGQIVFTAGVGYFILLALGFSSIASLYLSIALAFSSTIIVVKLLSEKRDLQSLYGKITVGFLLVQDFVAIGILIVLSGFSAGALNWTSFGVVIGKGILLIAVAMWLAGKILPRVLHWVAGSTEMLFITALAWCLGVAVVVASPLVGFSLEIGGFLAGLALANMAEHFQIVSRIRPLRDFFLTVFFVLLGININLGSIGPIIFPTIVLSLFVLVGNPLIVMIIMGLMGYKKRTSFLASITVAQISEFSLIVVALAFKVGHVDASVLALTALVGIVTMTVSSYMILNGDWLYEKLSERLSIFEKKNAKESKLKAEILNNHIVLIGHNRLGSLIRPTLEKLGLPLVIVDFNPETIAALSGENVYAMYGDLADSELYEDLKLHDAKLVISTVSDKLDNQQLLEIFTTKSRPVIIVTAETNSEADELYKKGADYVLVPRFVGGEYLSHILSHGIDRNAIQEIGSRHSKKIA